MCTLKTDNDNIDWQSLARVIHEAGLGTRTPEIVEQVFKGSYAACYAFEGHELVGAGRAISDGVTSSVIYDVVVLPNRQRQGIGTMIVEDLLHRLPKSSVMLLSVPGKCEFYRKFGFGLLKTAMLKHKNQAYWVANGYMYEGLQDAPAGI